MIELKNDSLVFSFPEVHKAAALSMDFQRTLRIPDDGDDYPLPPGLGRFPLRHVDDFSERAPDSWLTHGGVMLPMYQSEAVWLNFSSASGYPFAVKVAAGKVNAVTGDAWSNGLVESPQDYLVVPEQPWLDGYCVEKGFIRQFVAMPLGSGYSAEEQITGEAEHGGIQIIAYPMKKEAYERMRARIREEPEQAVYEDACYSIGVGMGLAPGGRMRQEVYDDPYHFEDWDTEHASRCFVHLSNSLVWRAVTGDGPPTVPLTSEEYTRAGLPWFEYYGGDLKALEGAETLGDLKSVTELGDEKGDSPLPENVSVSPENVITLRQGLRKDEVREGIF